MNFFGTQLLTSYLYHFTSDKMTCIRHFIYYLIYQVLLISILFKLNDDI
jgi:hypothetical protein